MTFSAASGRRHAGRHLVPAPVGANGTTERSTTMHQARPPRLAVVSRGDPLTPYLHAALAQRYPVVADIGVELAGLRRAVTAASTFRPSRGAWSDTYSKSNLGFRLRSDLAARGLGAVDGGFDVAVQTHALFTTRASRTMIYVDCTFRQAMVGWPAWTPQRGLALRRWLATETTVYRDAAHLFTFTDDGRTSLIEDYRIDPAKVTVVGAGANLAALPPVPRRATADRPTVLFVGKEFDRKGGDVLLRAFDLVRREVPAARLQIVGTTLPGPVPAGVEVLALVTDRSRLADLYASASVFCLPSRFEPGGIAVLEAMAYALPCVLSRGAAHLVPELTEPTGEREACRVADTGDAEGLAAGLIAYLQNPQLAALAGGNARQAVADRHLWRHVVTRMAPALEAAAAGR